MRTTSKQDDAGAHDVLLCVNTHSMRGDIKRMRMEGDQFFVRSPDEMYAAFPGHEEAVARSQEIANRVDIELDLKTRHFPVFTPPEGKTVTDYLRELCQKGLTWRYGDDIPCGSAAPARIRTGRDRKAWGSPATS